MQKFCGLYTDQGILDDCSAWVADETVGKILKTCAVPAQDVPVDIMNKFHTNQHCGNSEWFRHAGVSLLLMLVQCCAIQTTAAQQKSGPRTRTSQWTSSRQVRPVSYVRQTATSEVGELLPSADNTDGSGDVVFTMPLTGQPTANQMTFHRKNGLMSFTLTDAPLREVLQVLARSQGKNIMMSGELIETISGNFQNVSFHEAMDSLFSAGTYTWVDRNNVILVTPLGGESKPPPNAQGRVTRVFRLNYVSAADVLALLENLLSPNGQMFMAESDVADKRKTAEQIIVEDLPVYMDRIEQQLREIDRMPRQVLVEAYILQVDLKDDYSNGVDFSEFTKIAGADVLVASPNFNNSISPLATYRAPTFNIGIVGSGGFDALIQALRATTDAKTLASPKVLAVNGQESHVQIGERLGYFVTESTQTSTLQSVEFLDTGIVLSVTPQITDDNQILMTVKPQVSDGSVSDLGLPSERTTEVETTVMLPDGQGMVIGGLITEDDTETDRKIPVLGSLWGIGKLFRKTTVVRARSEIIIVLLPHIVTDPRLAGQDLQYQRATTPLLHGPLQEYPRPYEPKFPNADDRPRKFDGNRALNYFRDMKDPNTLTMKHYFPVESPAVPDASGQTILYESYSAPLEFAHPLPPVN